MVRSFIDVDYSQSFKAGQKISGDVFLQTREATTEHVVCTLSDGLGSGVKANVLANLTANMAHRFSFSPLNLSKSAKIIMNTLPVCSERKISYSTFTIADMRSTLEGDVNVQLVEYDNPNALYFRKEKLVKLNSKKINLQREGAKKEEVIRFCSFDMQEGDRLIMFTDGVTQAGMGKGFALGWREGGVATYIEKLITEDPNISSRKLAEAINKKAYRLDGFAAQDDITCAAIYVRKPRKTLVVTGPPFTKEKDYLLAQKIKEFEGKKIVSGGTTAQIVSRLFDKEVNVDLSCWSANVPPASTMEGIDLITEGMLTLSKVAIALEEKQDPRKMANDAVKKYVSLLLDSDHISFIVGTKINEAHQDPSIPVEIGIRRSIVGRLRRALEQIYLKETTLEYI